MTQVAIAVERLKSAPRLLAISAIAFYRATLSPMIHALNGPACRFEPSCSEYARAAIAEHGLVRGAAMAVLRIARCNPLGGHGYDPVPHSLVPRREAVKAAGQQE